MTPGVIICRSGIEENRMMIRLQKTGKCQKIALGKGEFQDKLAIALSSLSALLAI